jgi:hypothetical protein
MSDSILTGRWNANKIYTKLEEGFSSPDVKEIIEKDGTVFLVTSIIKLKIQVSPQGDNTLFEVKKSWWTQLGWAVIIPSALLFFFYLIGLIPLIILNAIASSQRKKVNNAVYAYLTKNEKKPVESRSASGSNEDAISQIEKLSQLKDKGILSEKEFSEKKKVLLDKINS